MKKEPTFYLKFYKVVDSVRPGVGARISVWVEDDSTFLMPCEFLECSAESDFYNVGVRLLDSERFYFEKNIGKTFYFGPPGHVIGYGKLEKISPGTV